jgi:hypothetical protein
VPLFPCPATNPFCFGPPDEACDHLKAPRKEDQTGKNQNLFSFPKHHFPKKKDVTMLLTLPPKLANLFLGLRNISH